MRPTILLTLTALACSNNTVPKDVDTSETGTQNEQADSDWAPTDSEETDDGEAPAPSDEDEPEDEAPESSAGDADTGQPVDPSDEPDTPPEDGDSGDPADTETNSPMDPHPPLSDDDEDEPSAPEDEVDDDLEDTAAPEALPADTDGDGYSVEDGDCDDSNAHIHPGAPEWCDGIDADCDGVEATHIATWFPTDSAPIDVTDDLQGTPHAPAIATITDAGTLRICAGEWSTVLQLSGEDIVVEGLAGAEATRINAHGMSSVVAADASVNALTIRGVQLTGGYAPNGGGLSVLGAEVTLEDVQVTNNVAIDNGGGIAVWEGIVDIRDSEIADNNSTTGGGIWMGEGALTLTDTLVESNNATDAAGGIQSNAPVNIVHSELIGNGCSTEGGALRVLNADVTLTDSDVDGNYAGEIGGGIGLLFGDLTLVNTTVTGNVSGGVGGGVYIGLGNPTLELERSFIGYNEAKEGGGAYLTGSEGTLGTITVTCVGDTGANHGFAANDVDVGDGGGLYVSASSYDLSSTTCDWGEAEGDNQPHDIATSSYWVDIGDNASFSCTTDDCEADAIEAWGMTDTLH